MADSTSNFPGVFRGNDRLASQQDLAILRQEIIQLIAGPINEVSENGYIPWKYNNDGSLDIEYLFPELVNQFKESTGLTINKNGVYFGKDIKTINFTGNFVYLDIDENGNLVCDIRAPKEEISRFNGMDGITDARIKIENKIIEDMIIPDVSNLSETSVYGDWEPGEKHPGINWNKNDIYDALKLYTSDKVFASSLSSYFEVMVFDAYNNYYGSAFISKSITGNTRQGEKLAAADGGHNFHIGITIKDFKEENNGFSFKPVFEINLIGLIGKAGGRFRIKIIHHDLNIHNTYVSQDLLYNVGRVPVIYSPYIQIINNAQNQDEAVKYEWCSGLKYVSNGTILLSVDSIRNLNNMAATDEKIEYNFDIANQKLLKSEFTDYDLKIDKVAKWQTSLYLNKETFNNTQTSGYIIAKNSFGESEPYYMNIPVLLNSVTTLKTSDKLNEYFSDETYRVLSNFQANLIDGNYSSLVNWNPEKDLRTYDEGKGLMVVPGHGLRYPYGDWSGFIPNGSPNYNDLSFLSREKFYARTFTGNDKLKFGGIFKFTGLTKDEFLDSRISLIISCDQGNTWFSLKDVRGTETTIIRDDYSAVNVTGVLTKVEEIDDELFVSWMYPGNLASSNTIYFKLGMKQTSTFNIKSISLLNSDGTEDW